MNANSKEQMEIKKGMYASVLLLIILFNRLKRVAMGSGRCLFQSGRMICGRMIRRVMVVRSPASE